ncbi:MAG TPA: DUF1549 and DUF1553 domain-containing protein [Humisphaera sp.]|nr:DUF1549 and DUF1553 domain-containing protein [Humisphaera sp.]
MNRIASVIMCFVVVVLSVALATGEQTTAKPQSNSAKHWSYIAPVRPSAPAVKDKAWVKNPIDAFVLARLEKEGLKPSPQAAPEVLCRRVYLDLVGLPPTPAQVDAFVKDSSENAYEKLVDSLLASPHYGERWARVWLDLARYADTNGYEKDNRRSMWKWRDWVIQSLNDDKPFTQFTIEQIAGDLLPNATIDQKIATGFHRNTMLNEEGGVDQMEDRWKRQVDRVATTSAVWLGTTMQCAQCHNHKYDPFTMKDFYSMLAFWESSDEPSLSVADESQNTQRQATEAEIAKLEKTFDVATPALAAEQEKWEKGLSASVEWKPVEMESFSSSEGTKLTKLNDGSLLASGKTPEKDAYTVTAKTDLTGITGFRLELLTDPSLPGNGPGRSVSGNLVLGEFKVLVARGAAKAWPIRWRRATADFSQPEWPVSAAIDGKSTTGWGISPEISKEHVAIFETAGAVVAGADTTLTFVLDQAGYSQHTIGRFRLSMTTSPRPADTLAAPAAIRPILAVASELRTDEQKKQLADYFRTIAPSLAATRTQIDRLKASMKKIPGVTTLVLAEKPGAGRATTDMRIRGSYLQHSDTVQCNTPASLPPLPVGEKVDRLALARWLVSDTNPLVARVTVNRYWETLFGRGIVETTEDFGTQGERPTHPELLDWLACEFMHPTAVAGQNFQPWSMKAIHRTMVLSATYRQSSRVSPELEERDPYNRLFARGPRFRLEAEAIRDNSLAIAGLLSEKMFGPSVMPYQPEGVWDVPYSGDRWVQSPGEDRYRRGVYTFWRRSAPYPTFMSFDAPSREGCTIRRVRTDTPMQALSVMNDPAFVETCKALARRMLTEVSTSDPKSKAVWGFRLCVARQPRPAEVEQLVALYSRSLDDYRKDATSAAEMSKGVNAPAGVDNAEAAAWAVVANVLMNLDETVTKG